MPKDHRSNKPRRRVPTKWRRTFDLALVYFIQRLIDFGFDRFHDYL